MNFSMNLKSTSCPMTITAEESLNEIKQDKATEKRLKTSIPESAKHQHVENPQSNQNNRPSARGGFAPRGRGRGRAPPNSQTTTQKIYTFTANITKEVITPKGVQKPRRI
jgi:hypothetical protein